jgi:hypothetical protein
VDLTDVMTINNTGRVTLNGGTINALQVDVNAGSLLGTGVVNATIVNNGGTVSPGLSPGILTLNGDYTQDAAGSMVIEIGGLVAGTDYDIVDVLASCALGGNLDVALIDGFTPGLGDSFEVLTCGALTGGFAMIGGRALGGGLILEPQYSANSLMLVVTPAPASVPALSGGALLLLGGLLAAFALWTLAQRPGIGG